MSVRPPTLREKKRYVLARIDPGNAPVEAKDLYYAMYEAVVSLFGDVSAGAMQPTVLSVEKGYGIFRCARGFERGFIIALSTLCSCRDSPVALRVLAVSGTVESLRERIAFLEEKRQKQPAPVPGESLVCEPVPEPVEGDVPGTSCVEYRFSGLLVEPVACRGHKVDVIEKGFKNTHRLFLTTQDLEIIHATTIPDGI